VEYSDPEEYLIEDQLREIEEIIREELAEVMAEEAIEAGNQGVTPNKKKPSKESKKRREGKKDRRERAQPYAFAFNNHPVHGRTIHNP
jgi:hypothetical protein